MYPSFHRPSPLSQPMKYLHTFIVMKQQLLREIVFFNYNAAYAKLSNI